MPPALPPGALDVVSASIEDGVILASVEEDKLLFEVQADRLTTETTRISEMNFVIPVFTKTVSHTIVQAD